LTEQSFAIRTGARAHPICICLRAIGSIDGAIDNPPPGSTVQVGLRKGFFDGRGRATTYGPRYAVSVESLALWVGLFAGDATIAGAAVAIAAIYVQSEAIRFSTSIDTLWRLRDQWSSRDMRCARVPVARGLRNSNLSTVEHDQSIT